MIYINLSDSLEESMPEQIKKIPKIFRKFIYNIRKKLGLLYIKIYDEKILIILSSLNNRCLKRLEKYIKTRCVKRVCLSNKLLSKQSFIDFLKGQDINLLNGNWLFDYILENIIFYVVENKNENIETQEISILSNNINEVLVENIKNIATKVKVLNIISNKEGKFRKIEKELYEEKGIVLNINNNYKKSLLKSDFIINLDFPEEEFNSYILPKSSCIILKNGNIKINSKSFEGICVTGYGISFPRKYLKYLIHFNYRN